jgi:hypothetical protein
MPEAETAEQIELLGRLYVVRILSQPGFTGSSDLSVVRSSPVWQLSVGCEHDAESVVLEVFEAAG